MTSTHDVVVLHGEQEFARRAGHLFAAVRSEFVCAASDHTTWAMPGARDSRTAVVQPRLGAGVAVHKLFTPRGLDDPAHLEHLVTVAEYGAQVRICTTRLAHETIMIDRRVAILAGPPVAGVRSYTVVRTPEVVQGVAALFWATWAASTDLAAYRREHAPDLDDTSLGVLRLMGEGLTDEAAARRLGLSVRTYRRRVAELMVLLGAGSRFQAGARARELGLNAPHPA